MGTTIEASAPMLIAPRLAVSAPAVRAGHHPTLTPVEAVIVRNVNMAKMLTPDEQKHRELLIVSAFSGNGIHMHAQPIFDVSVDPGKGPLNPARSFECLARLEVMTIGSDGSPKIDKVSPGEFLPIVEKVLGRAQVEMRIIEVAMRDIALMRDLNVRFSVNISPSTLMMPGCLETIAGYTTRNGIGPQHITLEILEGEEVPAHLYPNFNETIQAAQKM